ncbi:hypothetical protein DPMN_172573 [Dreissena polymorpha]|uniref:Uncharacterized protein n=1 Tax=Dreissena polymorpha TaxID=45954 RepID=A0A9D4IES0_DREPO|nr:hypothetical protein DPMN_172573 [Dreissena polymorpha]
MDLDMKNMCGTFNLLISYYVQPPPPPLQLAVPPPHQHPPPPPLSLQKNLQITIFVLGYNQILN